LDKPTEYKISAETAARVREPLIRKPFLSLASDYDFLAVIDEKIARGRENLP